MKREMVPTLIGLAGTFLAMSAAFMTPMIDGPRILGCFFVVLAVIVIIWALVWFNQIKQGKDTK